MPYKIFWPNPYKSIGKHNYLSWTNPKMLWIKNSCYFYRFLRLIWLFTHIFSDNFSDNSFMFKFYLFYLIKSTIVLQKQSGYTYGHGANICEDMYMVLNNIVYDNTNKIYYKLSFRNVFCIPVFCCIKLWYLCYKSNIHIAQCVIASYKLNTKWYKTSGINM